MSQNKTNYGGGGISFAGLLTIVFIVLKLTNNIDWSWWWVLSPLWITFSISFVVVFIVSLIIASKG